MQQEELGKLHGIAPLRLSQSIRKSESATELALLHQTQTEGSPAHPFCVSSGIRQRFPMHAHLLLKQAREQADLTLDAVAKQIGITAASMSRLETGQVSLTLERAEALTTIYGISLEALVTGSLVTRPTSIDLERIGEVIELAQDVILERRLRPSGKKVGAVVTAVYRTEIDRIGGDPTAAFDVERHRVLVEAMFQG